MLKKTPHQLPTIFILVSAALCAVHIYQGLTALKKTPN